MSKAVSVVLLLATAAALIVGFTAGTSMTKGGDGDDAYELWKSEGNGGSESDFLEWIKEKSVPPAFDSSDPSIFDSAVFESKTVVYDGSMHSVSVSGVPEGTKIVYANNSAAEVGEYRAFAYLENNGDTKVLTTLLKIEKAVITGYSFKDTSITYDGGTHMLTAQDLPNGVSAQYLCGGVPFTGTADAGEYVITAELSGGLYENLTVTAKLTIEKAEANLGFAGKTAEYDLKQTHSIAVTGTVPDGVSVTYKDADGNAFKDAKIPGEYEVTAVISGGKNYNDAELKATLTITKADLSKKIFFNNATFKYDGTKKMIYVSGTIPEDASVRYTRWGAEFDGITEIGSPVVTATFSGAYYKEFKLDAQIHVVKDQLGTPANVTASDKNLTWARDTKAGSYEVAVYDKSDVFIFSVNSSTDTLSFEEISKCRIESLLKRQYMHSGDYIIRVKAFPSGTYASKFAESEYSASVEYIFTAGKLYPPENVRVENGTLKWDTVPEAEYYDIAVQFVDDDGNVIKEKEVSGKTGNKNTSMSVNEIAGKTGFGPGNYKFAVFATPTSMAPGGIPAKDIFRMSDHSDFTNIVVM